MRGGASPGTWDQKYFNAFKNIIAMPMLWYNFDLCQLYIWVDRMILFDGDGDESCKSQTL